MRVSRFLRQRAQMNRTRYAMRALASVVLPSLVDSMQAMNELLDIALFVGVLGLMALISYTVHHLTRGR